MLSDPESVAVKVGTIPEIGFEAASLSVIVTVEVAVPLAMIFVVPVIVDCREEAAPGEKTTLSPVLTTGEVILRVLVSALREVILQKEIPEVFEAEHGA